LKRQADDGDFGRARRGSAMFGNGPKMAPAWSPLLTGGAQIVFKVDGSVRAGRRGRQHGSREHAQRPDRSGMADDLLDQLVAQLQGEYGVAVNRAAIEQALAF
jgi:peptidyl-prolyl cis-trans isomerase D